MINQESRCQPHLLLWAKSNPYKQLLAHMLDTGYCTQSFLSAPSSGSMLSFLTDQWHCGAEEALAFSAYLTALHDIGKAMPQFQRQDEARFTEMKNAGMMDLFPSQYIGHIEHEYYSAKIIQRIWKKICPTCVGMNRLGLRLTLLFLYLPHMRGDEPVINLQGKRQGAICPTCVGMNW